MLLYTRPTAPRVPKRRSRAGCTCCKAKKRQCDEARLACTRCQERGQECIYEPVQPRRRRKRASTVLHSPVDNNPSPGPDQTPQTSDYYPPTPKSEDHGQNRSTDGHWVGETPIRTQTPPVDLLHVHQSSTRHADKISSQLPSDLPQVFPLDSVDSRSSISDERNPVTLPFENDQRHNLEDIGCQHCIAGVDSITDSRPGLDSHVVDCPSPSVLALVPTPPAQFNLYFPLLLEFSNRINRHALIFHFRDVLSHLIVFHEERGNPFQQLILPLCQGSQAVTHSVLTLASAHLEYRGVLSDERSVDFYNRAVCDLACLIEKGAGTTRNQILAAIMLLVYYEVLVRKCNSNIITDHLKGAMAVMSQSETATDTVGMFLERVFGFCDVIIALSFGSAPLLSAPRASYRIPFPPPDPDDNISLLNSVDTLVGMAISLWPTIHRLSSLPVLKNQLRTAITNGETSKAAVLKTELEVSTSAIEAALKVWRPILPKNSILNQNPRGMGPEQWRKRSQLQSILSNALSYRHSALIFLYRTIYDYPRTHPLVQRHAQISLTHCAEATSNNGPMNALLWPLFIAACEATSPADRKHACQAFITMNQQQGMANIERAWIITQEVWRRIDEEEMSQKEEAMMEARDSGKELWRQVIADMGMSIVLL